MSELLPRIRRCLQSALKLSDSDTAAVGLDTTPVSVPEWNSLGHLELILTLERNFDVTFEAGEIMELASVAAIVRVLEERRPG